MAKAEKGTVETVVEEEGIILHLTMAEVRTLYAIGNHIGGDDRETPRRHVNAFRRAVEKALGVNKYNWDWVEPENSLFSQGQGSRLGLTPLVYEEYQT